MRKTEKQLVEELHKPFSIEDREEIKVTHKSLDADGIEQFQEQDEEVFPQWLYARRLDDVFGPTWSSKIEGVDFWGMEYLRCNIEVELKENLRICRKGMTHNELPFNLACEMFGIGGIGGDILTCARQLNRKYGLSWDFSLEFKEDVIICEIEVQAFENKQIKRTGVGNSEEGAFISACQMFGIDPRAIPF